MDEPFIGLDPVNVALLKEAFLEMRDRGKTLVFSTHQMETVEELCESVAIIDRGRVVLGGPIRDVRRSTGRQVVRLAVEGDPELAWLRGAAGRPGRPARPGLHRARRRPAVDPETDPPRGARPRRARDRIRDRRPVARGDLHREASAAGPTEIEHLAGAGEAKSAAGGAGTGAGAAGTSAERRMSARSDRTSSPSPAGSTSLAGARARSRLTTIVLVLAGLGIALAPVILRALFGDRKQTTVDVFVGDVSLPSTSRRLSSVVLNAPVGTVPPARRRLTAKPAFRVDTVNRRRGGARRRAVRRRCGAADRGPRRPPTATLPSLT